MFAHAALTRAGGAKADAEAYFAHIGTVTMSLGRDAMTAKALAARVEISESESLHWANIKKLPFVSDGQGGLYVERRYVAQWQEAIRGAPGS